MVLPLAARTGGVAGTLAGAVPGDSLRIGCGADAVEALAQARKMLWKTLNAAAFLIVNETCAGPELFVAQGWRASLEGGNVGACGTA
jgi:hypothetical protein